MTSRKKITLILEDHRFQVDKRRIMERSRYFESLFSHDFCDSKDDEQTVNYKVDPTVMQDFCDWIEEDPPCPEESHQIKMSLQKFLSDNFDRLKQLLELSVIYSVEELSLELSDVVIQHWLKPELLIEIWKLSREVSLVHLRDAAYSACLDRFSEIPEDDLMGITGEDFLQLVCNVNVKSSKDYLAFIAKERLRRDDSKDLQLKLGIQKLLEVLDSPDTGRPSVVHCIFAESLITCDDSAGDDCTSLKRVVYAVRKCSPLEFWELVEIWKMEEPGKDLTGMSVVGRDFSIYKIGGELRLGSGKFNMNIWRYCLLSKKWYYLARLRKARRHMAVALVNDKLILLGGVGRYRLKLSSVEMLNLHTGLWTDAPGIPETFTDAPPTCVINGVVVLCVSRLYMFDPSVHSWIEVRHDFDSSTFCGVKCLASYQNTLFIGKEGGAYTGFDVTWDTLQLEDGGVVKRGALITLSEGKEFENACERLLIGDDGQAIGMTKLQFGDLVTIERGCMDESTGRFNSELFGIKRPNLTVTPVSCFNLIDPNTLYRQIVHT